LQIADTATGWRMSLSGGQNLNSLYDDPFFLDTPMLEWPMTLREASFVAFAAKRVLRQLELAAQGREFKLGPSFKKALPVVDDAEPMIVEFGLRKDGDEKDPPRVYFRVGNVTIGCSNEDGYRLLGALCRYGEADEIGNYSRPTQLSVGESMRDPELALPNWANDAQWDEHGRRR
jgi:hypothetical protein